jgi:hypothetical protein
MSRRQVLAGAGGTGLLAAEPRPYTDEFETFTLVRPR